MNGDSEPRAFECADCSSRTESDDFDPRCPRCGSAMLLSPRRIGRVARSDFDRVPPGVWRFRAFLPDVSADMVVTLGEGGTPLLPARRLGGELGLDDLMIKDETMNPTGSFIDRGSTVLVSLAKERRVRRLSCVTTGNLGASLAAYSAKAGIETVIRIGPSVDRAKLYQMIAYGSKVEVVSGASGAGRESSAALVSAGNPFLLEGEKTTAFEILHDLEWSQPDAVVVPVGTGGHLTMMRRALLELQQAGLIGEPGCRLIGVQLEASAPIVGDMRRRRRPRTLQEPLTELEGSEPIFRRAAIRSMEDSGGTGVQVSTKAVIQAMSLLAKTEGIFAEPAAASAVAALKLAREEGLLARDDRVVCVVTGTGLKDAKAIGRIARPPRRLAPAEDFVIRPLDLGPTKLRLMRAMARGPSFGYGLWKSLSEERRITTASVYQHLSELEDAGLARRSRVEVFRGRERVFYELTRKGSEILNALGP